MARRRRIRRPWYRTRAYRLARTAVLTVSLVAGGVWWAQDEEPGGAAAVAPPDPPGAPGARVDARAAQQERLPAGTGLHGPPPGRGGTNVGTGTGTGTGTRVGADEAKPTRPGGRPRAGGARREPSRA
ncbi:hypothetical protein ACFWWR_35260, partial [Streptomyces sp. NPDC058678]